MCKELQTNIYIAKDKHTQSKINYLWNENVCSDMHIALSLHQCIAFFFFLIYLIFRGIHMLFFPETEQVLTL